MVNLKTETPIDSKIETVIRFYVSNVGPLPFRLALQLQHHRPSVLGGLRASEIALRVVEHLYHAITATCIGT